MKTCCAFILCVFLFSCSNERDIKVIDIDQLVGVWKWESTCGGIINNCSYPSKSLSSEVDFLDDGQYVHKTNGTIDLKAKYTLKKLDNISGTIALEIDTTIYTQYASSHIEFPIHIPYNKLLFYTGELVVTYSKIK